MRKKSTFNSKKIPLALYRKIVALMPIPCVDVVLKSDSEVFLFKRAYEPAKNKWWLIGGRILKDETLEQAVRRKARDEVGIEVDVLKMIGIYEEFFKVSRFDENGRGKRSNGTHTLSICFVAQPKRKDFKLRLNDEYSDYRAISRIEKHLEPYIRKVLRDSSVFR